MSQPTVHPSSVSAHPSTPSRRARPAIARTGILAGVAAFLLLGSTAQAQSLIEDTLTWPPLPTSAKIIEEDWEIVMHTPDSSKDASQITNVMYPGENSEKYALFTLNHRTHPDFAEGGLQLQSWLGNTILGHSTHPNTSEMSTQFEKITYTLKMFVLGDYVYYEVINGASSTWGAFGGDGYLKISQATSLLNLSNYHPKKSIEKSQITFGANRVQSFTLKEVRAYDSNKSLLQREELNYVVYSLN